MARRFPRHRLPPLVALAVAALVVVVIWSVLGRSRETSLASRPEQERTPAETRDALESRAPVTEREAETAPAPPPSEVEEDSAHAARLLFLALPSRQPPLGSRWVLERHGERVEHAVETPEDAELALDAGRWRLRSASDAWRPLVDELVLETGRREVAWVHDLVDLVVRVRDERGELIEGASVWWETSRVETEDTPEVDERSALRTDEHGEARLVGIAPTGTVHARSETREEALRAVLDGRSPVELVLRPARGEAREVRIVRAEDGAPLAGARIGVDRRPVGSTDSQGLVRLPATFTQWASASAPGRASVWFGPENATVPLPRSVPVRCRIVGRLAPTDTWTLEAKPARPAESSLFAMPPPPRSSTSDEIELPLPEGSRVELRAWSEDGRIAHAEIEVPAPGTPAAIELVLSPTETLELAVVDESGSPLSCELRVHDGRPGSRLLGPRTEFTLGEADSIHTIRIDATGHVARQLRASKDAVRHGSFVVELERGRELRIEVNAPSGDPVPGLVVWLSPEPPAAKPGIPGWTERTMPGVGGTTDADGRIDLAGLVEGEHSVSYRLPWELCPESSTLYRRPRGTTISVPRDGPLRLVIPRPRLLELHATDAVTGAPLEELLVEDTSWMTHESLVPGSIWTGWIPEDWSDIAVGARGYRRERVALEAGVERLELEVALEPEEAMTLEVEGDLSPALGKQVWIQMLYPSPDGTLFGGPGWHVLVEDPHRLEVRAPSKPGANVSIQQLSLEEGTLRFEPEYFPYEPGTTRRVRATLTPRER